MESALEQVAAEAVAHAVAQAESHIYHLPPPKELESFGLKRVRYVNADKVMYRVYEREGHFKLVEAASAHEAFAKSGVSEPMKIEREHFFTQIAIDRGLIEPTDEAHQVDIVLPEGGEAADGLFVDLVQLDADIKAAERSFEPLDFFEIVRQEPSQADVPSAQQAADSANAQPEQAAASVEPVEQAAPLANEAQSPSEVVATAEPASQTVADEAEVVTESQAMDAAEPPAEPERPLTADEVNALLSDGDE